MTDVDVLADAQRPGKAVHARQVLVVSYPSVSAGVYPLTAQIDGDDVVIAAQ